MSVQRKPLSRINAPYPRLEEIVINNTGADLASTDIGGVVLLDWTPSGTNGSAIAPSTAAKIATYRKALVLDLLGSGKQGTKIRVLLQGEESALVPTGVSAKDPLVVGTPAATGTTPLAAGTGGGLAAALAANSSGSTALTQVFFDGTETATASRRINLVQTAAGTALTNSTTETALGSATIPANALKPGDRIKIRFQGICTATNSTDTLAVKLYIGGLTGTALISMTATDVADNNVFTGEYELTVRTVGASGTIVGVGTYKSVPAAEGTMTIKDDILASTAIDTTVAQVVAVSGTWSVASASDSCRLDILNVEVIPA